MTYTRGAAETFTANADAYLTKLSELARYTTEVLSTVPVESRVVLSSHDAFNYFGDAYGFEVVGIQGISTEAEAGLQRIAYLPQRAGVDWDFPTTIMDVVMMGLYRKVGLLGRLSDQLTARAKDCLDRVGMADLAHRQIGQLSGGQQQRVFIARALAQDADLYLLDEPFAGVDAATERAIVDLLKLLEAENKGVVAVHHDLSTVQDYFDHVFLINVQRMAEGPVELAFNTKNLQATYGGRLAATHLDDLAIVGGAR